MYDLDTHFECLKRSLNAVSSGSGFYMCRCVCHDDTTPSMSIKKLDYKIIVNCKSGCDEDILIQELKNRNLWNVPQRKPYNPNYKSKKKTFKNLPPQKTAEQIEREQERIQSEQERIQYAKKLANESEEIIIKDTPTEKHTLSVIRWLVYYRGFLSYKNKDMIKKIPFYVRYHRIKKAVIYISTQYKTGSVQGVQLEYIDERGNPFADFKGLRKRNHGVFANAFLKLTPNNSTLIVCESGADALAVFTDYAKHNELMQVGIYAVFGTSGITSFANAISKDKRIKKVIVSTDNDTPGSKAKEDLSVALILAGREDIKVIQFRNKYNAKDPADALAIIENKQEVNRQEQHKKTQEQQAQVTV